jgi:O-antigen ligase
MLIVLKYDLANLLLLWVFFAMFQKAGKLSLPLLPDISPSRLILVLIGLFFLLETILKKRKRILPFTSVETAMAMFCMLCIFSMTLSGTLYSAEKGLTLRILLTGFAVPYAIFFISKNVMDNEQKIKKTLIVLSIIGFYLGITGIFEYYQLRSFVFPSYITAWRGSHIGKASGPFLQSGVMGGVLGMILHIPIYLLLQKNNKWLKRFLVTTIVLMLVSLLFTFNRAAWLGFALSSLLAVVFNPRIRKTFFIGLLIMIILIVTQFTADQLKPRTFTIHDYLRYSGSITERISGRLMSTGSVYGRINLYGVAWRMFREKPFFGIGFNRYFSESPKYFQNLEGIPYEATPGTNLHDTYTKILVELGLVGLGLYLFILLSIFRNSIKLYFRLPPEVFLGKGVVVAFWGMSVVYLARYQFSDMTLFVFINSLFYLVAGIICGLNQRALLQYKNDEVMTQEGLIDEKH